MKQNNCTLIGLTGGIATGKSTVTKMLRERGYMVVDADAISRESVQIGKPAYDRIVELFGVRILLDDKTINRKKLGRLIFDSSYLRDILNRIVHPSVFEEIKRQVEESCIDDTIIFLDVPLLFEVIELFNIYDLDMEEIWMVYTDKETQLIRLMERDNINIDEATSKIKSQLSVDEKREKSTKILYNNGDLMELENNLDLLLMKLR